MKRRLLRYKGYEFHQNSINNHTSIIDMKSGEVVFRGQHNKFLTESEAKAEINFFIEYCKGGKLFE